MKSRRGIVCRLGSSLAILAGVAAMVTIGASASSAAISKGGAPARTVWLCRPGLADDPCTASLSATSVSATGASQPSSAKDNPKSKFDCFYVYPTVSGEKTVNADLTIQAAETGVAQLQASRFSQVCRVWAPMYRQVTSAGLVKALTPTAKPTLVAYDSLLAGWKDYLAHDNQGRPIIFIGHSQGAAMLIRLLSQQIDPSPALRARMVSAIILGGNVQVPVGQDVGGSFQHIPTCASVFKTGCVIAYSTFGTTPPANALFGRPAQGVSAQSDQTTSTGQQVACVNPANLSSGPSVLQPYFPSASTKVSGVNVSTPWVTFPNLYSATCESLGGATWLQVTSLASGGDPRPTVTPVLGPAWGLHVDDVNLALGNLVLDVALQEKAYR
ncbi:MAG TPA: DUF3089 domain-containing protein [Acidimicrobiales bacterium]|jgi:hypothetical protein|nr:DUF3089 domain-containing protein [Acidimicrobiales bacterium]